MTDDFRGLHLASLGVGDAARCRALSDEAGWNQTDHDWRLMLKHGTGFGLEDDGRRLAATALVLPFARELAWISMVLVTAERRRQGLASRLVALCLAYSAEIGHAACLDATPAGAEVYGRLGFRPVLSITRWRAERPAAADEPPAGARAMRHADLAEVAALDRAAFGDDRLPLLHALFARAGGRAFVADGEGCVLARDGRLAWQIGPLIARNGGAAERLLAAALAANGGSPAVVDLCDRESGLAGRLQAAGFTPERGFQRMRLGSERPPGQPGLLFATAGPELG